MRPVICTIDSAAYKLSKFLSKTLSPIVGNFSPSHINNSTQFVEELSSMHIDPSHQMASFDVVYLFTMVPVDLALDFLRDDLIFFTLPYPIATILALTRLCISGISFSFNSKFYTQICGFQMGGVLSSLFRNYFMEKFETVIAPHIIRQSLLWRRYVDDVYSIWPRGVDLSKILQALNRLVPSIQFTIERESNNSLPFLDVLIIKSSTRPSFKIYRKPSNNNHIIPYCSAHNDKTKRMAIISLFLRALRLVSPQHMDQEFQFIRTIASNSGFPLPFITDCENRSKKTYYATGVRDEFNADKVICLPYSEQFDPLILPLKKLGFTLVYKWSCSLEKRLIRNSPPVLSGSVYKILCRCGDFYVGQTGKTISQRAAEHLQCFNRGDGNSSFTVHYRLCDVGFCWHSPIQLFRNSNYYERNMLETAVIDSTKRNNFNLSPGLYNFNPFIIYLLSIQFKFNKIQ